MADSLKSTNLMKITNDTELISKSLGYIYLSCQRNKLLHGCLLPSILVHSIRNNADIHQCKSTFELLSKIFTCEFIFDPDYSADQVCFFITIQWINSIGLVLNILLFGWSELMGWPDDEGSFDIQVVIIIFSVSLIIAY